MEELNVKEVVYEEDTTLETMFYSGWAPVYTLTQWGLKLVLSLFAKQ